MRVGLGSIHQTLTPEATSVLNRSIAEARNRNHGQTTPLHVAATLLSSPSAFLRQACIKSHPNSSHPLQCRALELCFSVALERLPTAQNHSPEMEPPLSNALMAALKRAQAHQRRGSPEQQQQPFLAVKVELEQLIISILDDPSVSRVMREASFSSPAVKATIERSLSSSPSAANSIPIGLGFRPTTVVPIAAACVNSYLNPRLQHESVTQLGEQTGGEVKRVYDILLRRRKRNPVLVGESEPEVLIKELLKRIENKEIREGPLNNVQVIHLEKDMPCDRAQIPTKVKELGDLIEVRVGNLYGGGVVLNLGDLKWLVEQWPAGIGAAGSGPGMQQVVMEAGRVAVAKIGKLIARFGENGASRLWLIGSASCETYLRCQVYHPTMENDWDLQAVPIATRAPIPGIFMRLGANGMLGSSLESPCSLKGFPVPTSTPAIQSSENLDPARRLTCCPQCMQNYEQEMVDTNKEFRESDSESQPSRSTLPLWLQNAKSNNEAKRDLTQSKNDEVFLKNKTEEMQKKWRDTCLKLHPTFHQQNLNFERITPTAFSMKGLGNPNFVRYQPLQKKVNKNLGVTMQLNLNQVSSQPSDPVVSPPGSLVQTDLVLGQKKANDPISEQTHKERIKDFLGCISSEPPNQVCALDSFRKPGMLDADSCKKLLKGLMEKVWWQQDAASAVATTVTQCKLGNGKRREDGTKSNNIWLLFMGPDRVGKKKMASALSEQIPGSSSISVSLGSRRREGESDVNLRGKTALDCISKAVRRNPSSVITLEDIDEADMLVLRSIKQAMDTGRLADSHGREVSLRNIIFILTAHWLPDNLKYLANGKPLEEEKLSNLPKSGWKLKVSISKRKSKRHADWVFDKDRTTRLRKEIGSGLGFDLNEAADDVDNKRADGSHNSSDLTIDHEDDNDHHNRWPSPPSSSISMELLDAVDDAIVFKRIDFDRIRHNITRCIMRRLSNILGYGIKIEVRENALERITDGIWLGRMGMEEWIEKVVVPSFHQLKGHFPGTCSDDLAVVRLEADSDTDSDGQSGGDWLPSSVNFVTEA